VVTVVNLRKETCDIPVCRPTVYGNFPGYGNPEKAVEIFANWFYSELGRKLRQRALIEISDGMKIGCHCAPKSCHADIIAGYLNWKRNIEFNGPKARTVLYGNQLINGN
jgi:hypothetical protein